MKINKKHCLIFLTILLTLILGVTMVSATTDTNNSKGVTDNKELSTPNNYDVDKMVQSSIAETKLDANVEKTTNNDNTNTTNKTITKNTQKNTKQETEHKTVTQYSDLRTFLTGDEYTDLTVTIENDLTSDSAIIINSEIKNLVIEGNGKTINGNSKAFLTANNLNLTIKNLTITNCAAYNAPVLLQNGGETKIVNSTISNNKFTSNSENYGIIKVSSNGILVLDNNTIDSNSIYDTHGFIIHTTKTSKIVNNLFISNNCHDTSNDFSGLINVLVNEIHDNEYVNNKLDTKIEDSFLDHHNQVLIGATNDYKRDMEIIFGRSVFNDTVRNGTLNVAIGDFYSVRKSFTVENGVAHVLITREELDLYHNPNEADNRDTLYFSYVPLDDSYKNVAQTVIAISEDISPESILLEITEYNESVFIGDNVTIKGNIGIKNGEGEWIDGDYVEGTDPLPDVLVTLIADDETTTVTARSDSDGNFVLNLNTTKYDVGQVFFNVGIKKEDMFDIQEYFGDSDEESFTIKANTNITLSVANVTLGESVTITGQVYIPANGKNAGVSSKVSNKRLGITINNETPVYIKMSGGKISYTYTPTGLGEYNVSVTWAGTASYLGSTNITTFYVNPVNTNMTIDNNETIKVGQNLDISGVLLTSEGAVVKSTKVNITVGSSTFPDVPVDANGKYSISQPINELGNLTITVVYTNHTTGYNSSTNTSSVNVLPRNTNMTINNNESIIVGQKVSINGTLYDELGEVVKSTLVNITVGTTKVDNVPVDENGTYETSCVVDEVGTFNITVNYTSSNINYTNSVNMSLVTVMPRNTNMTITNNDSILAGQKVNITGKLYDEFDEIVKDTYVNITIGEELIENVIVNSEGKYNLMYQLDNIGIIPITVTYNNDTTRYYNSTNTSSVTVNPRNTYIVIDDISPVYIGQNVTITGTLYDELDEIIPDTHITIRIDKNYINEEVSVDSEGLFELSYNATSVGEHNITIIYNNDTTRYINSTNKSSFTVNPRTTNMTINNNNPIRVGENLTISGTLTDNLGEKVTNTLVNITVGNQKAVNVPVDGNGYYEKDFQITQNGSYNITVEYTNTTTSYISSVNTSQVQIDKIPTITNVTVVNDKVYNVTIDVVISENNTNYKDIIEKGYINVTVNDESKLYPVTGSTTRIVLDANVNIPTTDDVIFKVEYVENSVYLNSSGINSTSGDVLSTFKATPINSSISVYVRYPHIFVGQKLNITGQVFDENGRVITRGRVKIVFNNDTGSSVISDIALNSGGEYYYCTEYTTSRAENNVSVEYLGEKSVNDNYIILSSYNNTTFNVHRISTNVGARVLNNTYGNVTVYVNVTNSSVNHGVVSSDIVREGRVVISDYYNPWMDSYADFDLATLDNPGEFNKTLPLYPGFNRVKINYYGIEYTDKFADSNYGYVPKVGPIIDYMEIFVPAIDTVTNISLVDPDSGVKVDTVYHGEIINITGNVTSDAEDLQIFEYVNIEVYAYNESSEDYDLFTVIENVPLEPESGNYTTQFDTTGLLNTTTENVKLKFVAVYECPEFFYAASSSTPVTLNVIKKPSTTRVEEILNNKSGEVALRINVTNSSGNLIPTGHVVIVDSTSGELLGEGDLDNGKVNIDLPSLTVPGEARVNITFMGNEYYATSNAVGNTPGLENTTTITVLVNPSITINLNNTECVIGESVKISGIIYNSTHEPVTSGSVKILIDDNEYTATLDTTTGEYKYDYVPETNGTKNIKAVYTDSQDTITSEEIELHVNKINSTTTIVKVLNNTAGNVTLEISVRGVDGNSSMNGKVNITIYGYLPVAVDYSGESIIVPLRNNITQSGLINVKVEFAQNDNYYSSVNETRIAVVNQVPILQLSVEDDTVVRGNNAVIIGNLSDDLGNKLSDAYIEISIDDKPVATVKTDTTGAFRYEYPTNKTGENIPVIAVYKGDDIRYDEASNNTLFNVIQNSDYELKVEASNITYGETETITVTLPGDAKGIVTVNITGMPTQIINLEETSTLTIPAYSLNAGEYEVNISYTDTNYALKTNKTTFKVDKVASNVDVEAENITRGYDETISVTLPEYEHATGNISVKIRKDGQVVNEYVVEARKLVDGINTTIIENMASGDYTVEVLYTNDTNYNDSTKIVQFNVALPEISIFDSTTIMINETALIHGTVTSTNNPLTGNIRLNINGTTETISIQEYAKGISQIFIKAGVYTINASYIQDDKVIVTSEDIIVTVNKIPTTTTIIIDNNKVGNTSLNVTVTDNNNKAVTSGTLKVTTPTETKTIPVTGNTTNIPITTTTDTPVQVTIEYTENNDYYNSTQNTQIKVNKINTKITVNVTTPVKSGRNATIIGILVDEDNKAISSATVEIKVDDKAVTNTTTDNGGKYTTSINESIVGAHTIEAFYAGNNQYNQSQDTTSLTVEKLATTITINTTKPVKVDENIEISGKLSDENNKAITDATVQVNYGGNIKNVTTDKDGNYKTSFTVTSTEEETITATFLGNNIYTASQAETSSQADKNTAKVQVNIPEDAKVGQPANITGKITNNNGKALANMPVTVNINDKPVRTVTDDNGNFQVEVTPTEGTNTVKVTAGDEDYSIDDVTDTFDATKSQAKVTVDPIKDAKAGQPTNITGKVTDTDGKPLANMPVTVDVNGKPVRTVTDENGNFKLDVTPNEGNNTLKVNAGDKAYKSEDITKIFTAKKPEAKVTINPITDKKVGQQVTITGKLVDDENKPITNTPVKVTVNNNTTTAITGTNGNYTITTSDTLEGTNNVTVKYEDTKYDTTTAKTTFKATKLKVKVTVLSINGTLGEDITLTARLTDELGNPVSGGNLVFKMNGKTLRTDGKFNSNSTPYKFKVENGIVTYTMTADKFIRDGKNLTASYSGSYKYEQAKANTASVNIRKRTAQVKVTITPKKTRQNNDIVFTATLKDVTSNARNKTCLTENANLLFKLNGITIKDSKGQAQRIPVTSSVINYAYHVPTGMGGYDANGLKNYTVEAVYDNPVFYPGSRNSSIFHVERSEVKVNFIKTTIKSNTLSVKATFKDFENKYLVGTNKVCVKINGKTYKENGKVKYFNVKNGKVDLKGIKIASGTKVKEVMLVTGAREGYLGARATTTDITIN